MINIIKDYYNVIKLQDGYEVVDNKSFIKTRNLILKMKEQGFNKNVNILIKNPKYQHGFNDLKELKGLVDFKEVDLVDILREKLSIELEGITSSDIVSSIGTKEINSFIKHYNKAFTFKQNVIMFRFNMNNINFLKDVDDFVNFVLKNIDIINRMKREKNKTLKYLFDEAKGLNNGEDFLIFLNNVIHSKSTDEYVKSIIYNILFKDYKEFEKEIIGKPSVYREFNFKIEEETLNILIKKYANYLEELNLELTSKGNKIYIFEITDDEKLMNSIERATGVLEYEFNFFLNFIINKVPNINNGNLSELEPFIYLIENKFYYLLKYNDQAYQKISMVKKLIEKMKKIYQLKTEIDSIDSIDKWFNFYSNQYLTIKNDLSRENDIFQLLEIVFVDKRSVEKLKFEINKILTYVNLKYEEYLFNNYKNIHIQDKGRYSISSVLSKISNHANKKIILLVIDAMKWSIWEIVKNILEGLGYEQVNEDEFIIALIPTVTNISRLSLFSGNKYKTIIDEKSKGLYSFSYNDEHKHLKRFFKNVNIGFAIGGKEKFRELIDEDRDLYAFIYSESDKVLHGLTDINEHIIYYILKEQLDNIVKEMENKSDEEFYLIITTDHGTIDINNLEGISIEKHVFQFLEKYSIDFNFHGKYIRVFSDSMISENIYNEIYRYFKGLNYFYILRIEDFDRFFLPKIENGKYNLFYLICKYNYYLKNSTKSSNTHGGFSMDETIIPFAVFTKKSKDIRKVYISLDGNLFYNTNSELKVKIVNPNDFDIKNLHLSIKPLINDYVIDYIGKRATKDFKINLIPREMGTIKVDISIKYSKFGQEMKITDTKMIEIKEDLKTRISEDIKRSRRLDF